MMRSPALPMILSASLLVSLALSAPNAAQEPPPPAQPVLTIGEALRGALTKNPELANVADSLFAAQIGQQGIASTFLPQVTPFFSTQRGETSNLRSESYGVTASQLFPFGTFLEGLALVTRSPRTPFANPYAADYRLRLTQPLLRGADPAVTAEPLRQARRSTAAQERALDIFRRRTVVLIYQAYLGLARQQETAKVLSERIARARKLTEFSRARFLAGSVSRLDVLRAEQQEAAAVVAGNDADSLVEDFRDALRRTAGMDRDQKFTIEPPQDLPAFEPDEERAAEGVLDRRPEALEARDQITDSEFAVRIAKSAQLPSLQGVLTYEAFGAGQTTGDAIRPRNPALLFGFRSQYGLNSRLLYAQRRVAEIQLETRKRNYQILEDDFVREVRRAYRRLDSLRRNYQIAVENEQVAELQVKVAQLRFEKGLSDNFHVVDAENLLQAAHLLELDSRFAILLARLDCLYSSGRLEVSPFLRQP